MKNLAIALAIVAALTVTTLPAADAQSKGRRDGAFAQRHAPAQHRAGPRRFQHAVDRRQARQHARIRHGWRSGALSRKELSRLRRDQRRIGRLERRFGADGHYSRPERHVLKRALKHSSKRIWRMKHNYRAGRPHFRKHKRFHRHFRRPYRHRWPVYHVYPLHEFSPGYSRALEIETRDFRFSVNATE